MTVNALMTAHTATLHDLAVLETIAWDRKSTPEEVEARKRRLDREFQGFDPATQGIFVAQRSGVMVGVGRVKRWPGDPRAWMVFGVAVHPQQRRQGVGRTLVRTAIDFARSHGARTILSETHANNRASMAFHKAIGFGNGRPFTDSDGDHKIAYSLPLDE